LQAVVDDLDDVHADRSGGVGLEHVIVCADAVAEEADFALGLGEAGGLPHAFGGEGGVVAGVELKDVHVVGAQGAQGALELGEQVGGFTAVVALEALVEFVAPLGGDDPVGAGAGERFADEAFGEVVAVAFGCIDEVDTDVLRGGEDGADIGGGVGAPLLAAVLPGADSDDGRF
jgi:hypothetical protein